MGFDSSCFLREVSFNDTGGFTCALLDRMVVMSEDLFRVTRSGLGRLVGMYLPSPMLCALVYIHAKLDCSIVLKEFVSPSAQFGHFLSNIYFHPDSFLLIWNAKFCFVPVRNEACLVL